MNKAYSLEEFKKVHGETVRSQFSTVFSEPFLYVLAKGKSPTIYPLPDRNAELEVTLGSGADCDILLETESAAPLHLKIFYHKILREWCLADQGSELGTMLDDKKIVAFAVCSLNLESKIRFDDIVVRFYPVEQMADLIFPGTKGDTNPNIQVELKEEDLEVATPNLRTIDDPELARRIRTLLTMLTGGTAKTLLSLLVEARALDEADFLNRYPTPIVVLHKVVMKKGEPPLYDGSHMPANFRVFWKLEKLQDGGVVTIGRGKDCDIQLQAKVISKQHAELKLKDGKYGVYDLGSVNGLYVNDEPVPSHGSRRLAAMAKIGVSPHISLLYLTPRAIVNMVDTLEFDEG